MDKQPVSISQKNKNDCCFFQKRAAKDQHNRNRVLKRLEKQIRTGKLTKFNINDRGYNKYLKMEGEISIQIDYDKFNTDAIGDGLKSYITNTKLTNNQVIENYKSLWNIDEHFVCKKQITHTSNISQNKKSN